MEQEKIVKPIQWREPIIVTFISVLSLLMAFTAAGESKFNFKNATSWFQIPVWHFSSVIMCLVMFIIVLLCTGLIWYQAIKRKTPSKIALIVGIVAFIISVLAWMVGGSSATMPIVVLLAGGLTLSVPVAAGSLSGVLCERTGIINIAIEGQLLFGAFMGCIIGNVAGGNVWVGLIAAPIGGALVGALLGLFTIKLRTNHIVVGVVLNMLILGVTNFLYSTLLAEDQSLNTAIKLNNWKIPILGDIPIIGPILFNQSLLVYLLYALIIALQVGFFRTRWGLRSRACGEHPKAADTVGIKVNRMRWLNVILGGAVAGLGGAAFTLNANLGFAQNMSAGMGFIGLAAMILGGWNPIGAVAASLLFGFTTQLGLLMPTLGSPIPSDFLLMLPYIITIFAVAGFVGRVRPPAAEGIPYP